MMKRFLMFLLAATAVANLSCASRKPPSAAPEPEYVAPPAGPYQFCAAVAQLLQEAPDGFPSFSGRVLKTESIFPTECYGGSSHVILEARPMPWANLTGCRIETIDTQSKDGRQLMYRTYACEGGTDWEDSAYLFQMMKESLHVCFYGQFEFKENETSLKMKRHRFHGEDTEVSISYFPGSSPANEHLYLTVDYGIEY